MTIDAVRRLCRRLPGSTEDVKWGSDLVFSVGKKMFAVVCLDPPHTLAFKCTPDTFAELVERDGIIPAPYLARARWVQERAAGDVLDAREIEALIRASYDQVLATLPKARRPATKPTARGGRSRPSRSPSRRRRG